MNGRDVILAHYDKSISNSDWGKVLNSLQDIAMKVMSDKELDAYTKKSVKDVEECGGMDGLFLNNHYFDWKEFNYRSKDIVNAWLDYFSNEQVDRIANAIRG